jgi:hypothetical protein
MVPINDQSAELKLRSAGQASPNPDRSLTVDIAGNITGKLRSQGISFCGSSNSKRKLKRWTPPKRSRPPLRKSPLDNSEAVFGSKTAEEQGGD